MKNLAVHSMLYDTTLSSIAPAYENEEHTIIYDSSVVSLDKDYELYDVAKCNVCAVDAEWYRVRSEDVSSQPRYNTLYITKQFTFYQNYTKPVVTIVLWDSCWKLPNELPSLDHELLVIVCDVNKTVLKDVVKLPKKARLALFYSPKDVEAAIGREEWIKHLLTGDIKKYRNLNGKVNIDDTEFILNDWYGAFNCSLEKAYDMVNVTPTGKGLLKGIDKSKMNLVIQENPCDFLTYAAGDVCDFGKLMEARVKQCNDIIAKALNKDGVEMPQYTVANYPRSSGRLVATTFENWLMKKHPELFKSVLLLTDACADPDSKEGRDLQRMKSRLDSDFTSSYEILNEVNLRIKNFKTSDNYIHGLAMGSIRSYAMLSPNMTGLLGAMVQGGRCLNEDVKENPYDQFVHHVIDIDLSSCYGSSLRGFDYPFGIPTIEQRAIDDKRITLKEFLRRNRKELIPGLWVAVVSNPHKVVDGKSEVKSLSFEQDLIYSKYNIDAASIQKTLINCSFEGEVHEREDDNSKGFTEVESAHLGGDFVMTKAQINNGIITADVLEALEKTATEKEMNEILNLEVVCVVYYPASKEVSIEQFCNVVQNPVERGGRLSVGDTRTRSWCRISLEGFVGDFVKYRKGVKKAAKEEFNKNGSSELYKSLDATQDSVKLFVNTTYGCLAAPYFPMGNTIVANNITAKARVNVWLMSKALLNAQLITDGGMFSWHRVAYLKEGWKPGLHTLADRTRLQQHRNIEIKPLTKRDLHAELRALYALPNETLEEKKHRSEVLGVFNKEIDDMCLAHINNFWKPYGLQLGFDIECKHGHTAKYAVYLNASDYVLFDIAEANQNTPRLTDGTPICIKCRGAKEANHPKKGILLHLGRPDLYPVPDVYFVYTDLMGVKEFQDKYKDVITVSENTSERIKLERFLSIEYTPGEELVKETYHKPYKSGAVFKTSQDWKNYNRAKDRQEQRYETINRDRKEEAEYYGIAKSIIEGKYKINNSSIRNYLI